MKLIITVLATLTLLGVSCTTETDVTGEKQLADLRVGDCIAERFRGREEDLAKVSGINTVSCDDDAATLQVVALVQFAKNSSYPGEAQIELETADMCLAKDATSVTSLFPSRDGWERGELGAVCFKFVSKS